MQFSVEVLAKLVFASRGETASHLTRVVCLPKLQPDPLHFSSDDRNRKSK